MKNKFLISILFFLITTVHVYSSNIGLEATVDERVELLSIVFRLAGANEYSTGTIPEYNKSIDDYFSPYKDHKVVNLAKKLRSTKGISFNAVMSFAVNIQIKDSEIELKNELTKNSLDGRWNKKNSFNFLKYLNNFYQETNFHQFYQSNKELYDLGETRFNHILDNIDFTWFDNFYGAPPGDNFNVIIALVNGWNNYGADITDNRGKQIKYAFIGAGATDSTGKPTFSERFIPTVVHEFCHSYCNPIIRENIVEFENSGPTVFSKVEQQMKNQAYGNYEIMLYEYLVRASVVKYIEHNDTSKMRSIQSVATQKGRGFYFIDKLVDQLSFYESKRNEYKTLEQFLPNLVLFFNDLANNYDSFYNSYYSSCPKITFSSIKTGETIDLANNELTLKFNKPMLENSYGLNYGKGGRESMPEIDKIEWMDNKTLKIKMKLEKGKNYSLSLYNPAFLCADEYNPLFERFELSFKTQ